MRVVGLPKAFYPIVRHPPLDLSAKATMRLRLLFCWQAMRQQGLPSRQAREALGLPRATLYRWQRRLKEWGPQGLEERSRRPHCRRTAHLGPGVGPGGAAAAPTYRGWGKDKLALQPLPGVVLKQFTARDVVSRWDVIEVRTRATAAAAESLTPLKFRFPFPLQAVQVDGGSEFVAKFEGVCQRAGIRLFVLPPRSPKLKRPGGTGPPHPHRRVLGVL